MMFVNMKIIAIFITLFAVSLAAPSEVSTTEEKSVVPEKNGDGEKLVEKDVTAGASSDSSNAEEVVDKDDAAAPSKETASSEEKPPVIVIATSVEEEKTDGGKITEENKENEKRVHSEVCRASTGATEEQIAAMRKDPGEDAPKAVKCYVKCMSEAYGLVKDQVLQKDVVLQNKPSTLTTGELEAAIETCGDLKTDDPCDSAYLRYSCYFRTTGAKITLSDVHV